MEKKALIFLATGFEEIEAVTTIDLLRRAGVVTVVVSVEESLSVSGAHHLTVVADKFVQDVDFSSADALILPGGLPGVDNLKKSEALMEALDVADAEGKLLAAICAAPSILGEKGFLQGKEATCYPSFEKTLTGYVPTEKAVVVSGNIITGKSAGHTVDFALTIVSVLLGKEEAEAVRAAISPL